jgi:predicted methyltransferase
MNRRQIALGMPGLALAALAERAFAAPSAALAAAVSGAQRIPAVRARDAFRHPLETLAFWGLAPGMTVVEFYPEGGYWTEILAPYLKATGGRYVAVLGESAKGAAAFKAQFADASVWGPIEMAAFSATSGPPLAPATADLVITARNIHNLMWTSGLLDKALGDFHAALKDGAILGVEEHRADPRPMKPGVPDGYVETSFVIAKAQAAAFRLDGRSEINANPRDTKDYPFGVWTLPPVSRTQQRGVPTPANFDPAKYAAIGESDRMTLRFRKA